MQVLTNQVLAFFTPLKKRVFVQRLIKTIKC